MHKLIVLGALALTPLAIWIAGCRENSRQASFPRGPEVRRLAMSSSRGNGNAPDIPAAIDPEVLNAPDQPTFARIRAVMDREAQLSNRNSRPGLFVIPREDFPELATMPSAAPAGREFRSRPVQPGLGRNYGSGGQAMYDLSAMAAPDFPDVPGSLPPVPPPLDYGPDLPPEGDIPGVFLGGGDAGPLSLAPARPGGKAPIERELNLPPSLTSAAFDPAALTHIAEAGKSRNVVAEVKLTGWAPEAADSLGLAALFGDDEVRLALAPLPDLSRPTPTAQNPAPTLPSPVEMVLALTADAYGERPPAARDKPAETGNARYMLDFWDNYPIAREASAPTDPERSPSEMRPAGLDQAGEMDFEDAFPSVLEMLKALEPLTPARETTGGTGATKEPKTLPAGTDLAKPAEAAQKVTLLPTPADSSRRAGARKHWEKIDSSVDAPPLVF